MIKHLNIMTRCDERIVELAKYSERKHKSLFLLVGAIYDYK